MQGHMIPSKGLSGCRAQISIDICQPKVDMMFLLLSSHAQTPYSSSESRLRYMLFFSLMDIVRPDCTQTVKEMLDFMNKQRLVHQKMRSKGNTVKVIHFQQSVILICRHACPVCKEHSLARRATQQSLAYLISSQA